jgi:PAS domain S-box-containing protein
MRLSDKFWGMAEHFMEVVWAETGFPVLVYDDSGTIVRATDKSRIGDLHIGAEKIMQGLVDEYAVTPEEAIRNPLVREGYSCPIVVDGQRVAAFGITGKLEQTKPLAKVAVRLIDSWIADQKHQRQLEQSERKFRGIFDHSAQGIFQTSLEGRLITANPALARMYGYPSPEALLAEITDVTQQLYVHPEDRQRLLARLEETGYATGFLTKYRRRDGQVIDVSVNAHIVSDPATGQRLTEGIVEDITARRRVEKALEKSEEKYSKAFNNSPVLVVLSSLETGRYIEVNETFLRTMGYAREDLVGRTSLEMHIWADPDDRRKIQDDINATGYVHNMEVNRRTRDGRILTMLFSAERIDVAGETCMLSVSQDISERKKIQEEREASHHVMQSLLHAVPDLLFVVDRNFNIRYSNYQGPDLVPAEDREENCTCYRRFKQRNTPCENCSAVKVFASGQAITRELENQMDGRTLEIRAFPIFDVDGQVSMVVEYVRDITDIKTAEIEIRERQQFLESVLYHAPDAIITMDASHRVIDWNPGAVKMFGYSAEEALGRQLDDLVAPGEAHREADMVTRQVLSGKRIDAFETIRYHKDGAPVNVFAAGSPIRVGETLKGVMAVYTDITALKLAETQLKESHERFLTVLESVDATIYVADMDTHEILYMNQKMKQVFGGDFTGKECFAIFRNESMPCAVCTNERLVDEKGQPTGVCIWENKNPVTGRWFVNYDRAIRWVDGRMVRLQMATDITSQKRIETERKEYEDRFQQVQKMEAIGMLAGGIAHDFNNILSAVIGYSELALIDTAETAHIHSNIQQIHAAGMRAKDLVQQILTFSRQDKKELKPLQVASQIKEALKMLRSSLPTTIEIIPEISNHVDNVMADPTQIHQIVMNLCTNAAQAMEETGGRLNVGLSQVTLNEEDVRLHPGLQTGTYAKLSVQDTGAGIPAEIVDKIFDPYFTTKEKGKGTGLGLAVVHGIVQSYDGEITVDSTPGRGTNFVIYLPTIKATLVASPVNISLPQGNEKILLVDDETVIVDFGRQSLERLGYSVDGFTSSIDALESFRKAPDRYDLIITDMTMPKLPGDLLAQEVFKLRPDMPIILCTGYSSRIDSQKSDALGIRAMLMKPLKLSDLASSVRQVLDETYSGE